MFDDRELPITACPDRCHARLRIEKDHEVEAFGQGINLCHINKLARSPVLISAVLMAAGLYGRGISNATRVRPTAQSHRVAGN